MIFIEFNHNELIEKLQCIETDLMHFFKYPFVKELVNKYCGSLTGIVKQTRMGTNLYFAF